MAVNLNAANKDVRQLLKQLHRAGCTVERRNSGHWRVSREGRQPITVANSPRDSRTVRNIRADAKRYLGVDL